MTDTADSVPSENSQEPTQNIIEDDVDLLNQSNTDIVDDWA